MNSACLCRAEHFHPRDAETSPLQFSNTYKMNKSGGLLIMSEIVITFGKGDI